jgi:hypothetical protein
VRFSQRLLLAVPPISRGRWREKHRTSGRSGRSVTISHPPEVPLGSQSATITITHAVTVAVAVFTPGHLGELTQYLPFEQVDAPAAARRRAAHGPDHLPGLDLVEQTFYDLSICIKLRT